MCAGTEGSSWSGGSLGRRRGEEWGEERQKEGEGREGQGGNRTSSGGVNNVCHWRVEEDSPGTQYKREAVKSLTLPSPCLPTLTYLRGNLVILTSLNELLKVQLPAREAHSTHVKSHYKDTSTAGRLQQCVRGHHMTNTTAGSGTLLMLKSAYLHGILYIIYSTSIVTKPCDFAI